MLREDFYSVQELKQAPGNIQASLSLEPSHPIFAGHFPGMAVVPGVCMMQIIRELLELSIGETLQISAVHNLKFLSPFLPQEQTDFECEINYSRDGKHLTVNAGLFTGSKTFCKLVKGTFTVR